jgi:hypothetical protein
MCSWCVVDNCSRQTSHYAETHVLGDPINTQNTKISSVFMARNLHFQQKAVFPLFPEVFD